jgi:hypothetical protein
VKVGFTGTRIGMTAEQLGSCESLLLKLNPEELHHGDCIGADEEMHILCLRHSVPVVIHPPESPVLRAYCGMAVAKRSVKEYHARDRNIVDDTDELIAAPLQPIPKNGGTLYTINYARKQGRRVYLVWRDGNITTEEGSVSAQKN